MLYASFGHSRMGLPGPVEEILREVGQALDSYSAKLLLREAYEKLYGLFHHEGQESHYRPLALVALHPKEDATNYSKLYRTVRRYHKQKIKDLTGLDIVQFLNLPHEMVELWFQIAFEDAQREAPKIEAAARELERSGRRMQPT